ncbi:DUF3304 domain-containing protein (plasmid) [Enterobacter sp. JBIWA003]|uniref:DUF3304 domain-containing protein n=1 Tax=Enterobacter sp. JBIWA003 TaxID=2831890 RepID=UPI001CBD02C0|nr:DUF3304 domain-containing protein [Enterobacter sp. JBIWA003]UAN25031.1 DUF3304 domain-containing protein [Enterobacter sp. JBIWA003]
MNLRYWTLLNGVILLLTGTSIALAGTIEAINHTKWAINNFSVNGQSGLDAIGPFQGGGGGCCYSAPPSWKPGMTVRVDWETGLGSTLDMPEPKPIPPDTTGMSQKERNRAWDVYGDKTSEWFAKIRRMKKQHSRIVPLPPYTSTDKTCGITVHFQPCDQIKVTTSCADYGSPAYPVKDPIQMKEPAVCPK